VCKGMVRRKDRLTLVTILEKAAAKWKG
jgi:hypothetical protein